MPTWTRLLCALAAFPLGWAVRETAGGGAGGVVVLGLIGACALGLPARRAAGVVATGVLLFVAVHLLAAVSTIYVGLGTGAAAFAVACRAWAGSSSSAPRATPAT